MIKFDTNVFKNFTDAREKYAQLVKDAAKPEEQQQGFTDMMDALGEDTLSEIKNQVHAQTEDYLDARRHDPKMSNEEVKFFNEIIRQILDLKNLSYCLKRLLLKCSMTWFKPTRYFKLSVCKTKVLA